MFCIVLYIDLSCAAPESDHVVQSMGLSVGLLIAVLFFIGAVVHMRRRKMEKLTALGGDEDDERGHFVSNPGLSTARRQRLREIANYNG